MAAGTEIVQPVSALDGAYKPTCLDDGKLKKIGGVVDNKNSSATEKSMVDRDNSYCWPPRPISIRGCVTRALFSGAAPASDSVCFHFVHFRSSVLVVKNRAFCIRAFLVQGLPAYVKNLFYGIFFSRLYWKDKTLPLSMARKVLTLSSDLSTGLECGQTQVGVQPWRMHMFALTTCKHIWALKMVVKLLVLFMG
jgi:hypothetical protein